MKPPRTVFLRWPFGHPLGEPHNVAQQRVVLAEAFAALCSIERAGEIIDLPYRWRRELYERMDPSAIMAPCDRTGGSSGTNDGRGKRGRGR